MNLPHTELISTCCVSSYIHQKLFPLCLCVMKVFCKHGIISININVILNLEQCAALKKWFDYIDPLVPSRPIEIINTNTLEAIHPHLLCRLFDEGNDFE